MKNRLFINWFAFSFITLLLGYTSANCQSTDQFVKEIDGKMQFWIEEFIIPGAALALIDNGKIIFQKGYGYADSKNEVPIGLQTGFNIGSSSKTVAAWGVMKLVEEGKIGLDDPVEKYLTRWHFPKSTFDASKVTIRRLLSNTAGLSLHGYPGWSLDDELPSIEESLSGNNNIPEKEPVKIIIEPGTQMKYSGGGFSVLQLLIEEVTKKEFSTYMKSVILEPIGMKNSSFNINSDVLSNSSLEHNSFGEPIPFEVFTAQAAAGLHTTIEDFALFVQANIQQNQVLKPNTIVSMQKADPITNGRYGLAYMIDKIPKTSIQVVGHGGGNSGWHSLFFIDTKSGDGFVIFSNSGAGLNLAKQFYCNWMNWKFDAYSEYACKKSIVPVMQKAYITNGIEAAVDVFETIKETNNDDYTIIEYDLIEFVNEITNSSDIQTDKIKLAVAVAKIATEEFPTSIEALTSLQMAYMANGDIKSAVDIRSKIKHLEKP